MAIIAILILIAVPAFTKYIDRAKRTAEMGTASTINKSVMATMAEHYVTYRSTGEYEVAPHGWIYAEDFQESIKEGISGDVKIITGTYENLEDFYENELPSIATFEDDLWVAVYRVNYENNQTKSTIGGPIVVISPIRGGRRNIYEDGEYVFDIPAESWKPSYPQ